MKEILVLGAGKIGTVIAKMLAASGAYRVCLADNDARVFEHMGTGQPFQALVLDVTDEAALLDALNGKYAVISALPYNLTALVGKAARAARVHYFDLTEDVRSTRLIKELAAGADTVFMPQCGLAPGFISIVAYDLAKKFDTLDCVQLRVGALPRYPSNALKYNLTWSTEGLINEYCNPCEAIVDGQLTEVPPLEQLEHFSLDGLEYEAFNTSGGLGTLCETLAGRVRNLNYRTVRYPGHRDIAKMLLQDLKLAQRRDLAVEIFEHALPETLQDVVLIFVTVTGEMNGRYLQESYANKVYSREMLGSYLSGIQIATASGVCAVLDLVAGGSLPNRGFLRQEDVGLSDFLANRFGRNFLPQRPDNREDDRHESANRRQANA